MKGLRKNVKNFKITDLSVEIRTKQLPNTCLQRYNYNNLLGDLTLGAGGTMQFTQK
jgi:hypothetical protein